MATHSSVLVWRIPGTGEPGGLPSIGSYRVGHNWSDLAAAAAEMYSVFVWYKFLPFTLNNFFSSVQSLSHVRLFVIPWTAACQPSPSITNSRSLLKFMSIQPSHPLIPFSSCLQSFPASGSFPMSQFFTSVARVFEFQLQHQFFQWLFRTDFL